MLTSLFYSESNRRLMIPNPLSYHPQFEMLAPSQIMVWQNLHSFLQHQACAGLDYAHYCWPVPQTFPQRLLNLYYFWKFALIHDAHTNAWLPAM